MKKKRGISLIVLVITIIVMIILASSIIISINNTNITLNANKTKYINKVTVYKETLEEYHSDKKIKNPNGYNSSSINATGTDIKNFIKDFSDTDKDKFEIIHGELIYIGNDKNELKWSEGIIDTNELNFKLELNNNLEVKNSVKVNVGISGRKASNTSDITYIVNIQEYNRNQPISSELVTKNSTTGEVIFENIVPGKVYKITAQVKIGDKVFTTNSNEEIYGVLITNTAPILNLNVDSVTSNSATISVKSDVSTINTYNYYITKEADNNFKLVDSNNSSEFTFTGLEEKTKYNIKVTAESSGNIGEARVDITTNNNNLLSNIEIKVGNITHSSVNVSVIAKGNNVSLNNSIFEYSIKELPNGIYSTKDTSSNSNYTFIDLKPETVYEIKVKVKDNSGNIGYATVTVKTKFFDNISPKVNIKVDNITDKSIEVSVDAKDNKALPKKTIYNYYIKELPNGEFELKNSTDNPKFTFTGLKEETSYIIKVTVPDDAGNLGSSEITVKTKGSDIKGPTVKIEILNITESTINVKVIANDDKAMPSNPVYNYYIKEFNEANYGTPTSVNSSEFKFTGLKELTSYDIKVTTTDNAGNLGFREAFNVVTMGSATEGLKTGNLTATDPVWSNGKATIKLETKTRLQIEYQVNSVNGSWIMGTTVSNLNHNDLVYARLTDGKNHGTPGSVRILDNNFPNATISLSGAGTVPNNPRITATVNNLDAESGVNLARSKYVFTSSAANLGTNESSYTGGTFNSNNATVSYPLNNEGDYYLHVLTTDNAGHMKETVSNRINMATKRHVHTNTCWIDKGVHKHTSSCYKVVKRHKEWNSVTGGKGGELYCSQCHQYFHVPPRAGYYECPNDDCPGAEKRLDCGYSSGEHIRELVCGKQENQFEGYQVSY